MAAATVVQEWHHGQGRFLDERLAEIDAVIFDKTGTLTSAAPRLVSAEHIDSAVFESRGRPRLAFPAPLFTALVEAAAGLTPSPVVFDDITEQAGFGLQAQSGATVYRLGKPSWRSRVRIRLSELAVALTQNGQWMTGFCLRQLRTDAAVAVVS